MDDTPDSAESSRVLRELSTFSTVLAIKQYRLALDGTPSVPVLPCLDHKAMLHQSVAPHLAAYVRYGAAGDIHELVFIPSQHRLEMDAVSTWGECSVESRMQLLTIVAQRFPDYAARVIGLSWWRAAIGASRPRAVHK